MAGLSLPHRLDMYAPEVSGGSATLARANVAGFFELATPGRRVAMQEVSKNALAVLWLDLSAQSVAADGMLVFWRDRGTWWTMRGAPEVYDTPGSGYIEVMVAANVVDGFFASSATSKPLMGQFTSAGSVTAVKVEVSTAPDFASLAVNAFSATSQAGWYYASGGVWTPIPAGGLPSAATQAVVFVATGLLPLQAYFVRWTPYAGSTPLTSQLGTASW